MAVGALRTMAVELQLVHSTITSGVDELSEKLEAIRDALQAWRRPRSGHTGRVRASRLMMSTWGGVAGL